MVQKLFQLVDVLYGVFQGLYFGQRLSSLAVVWRKVVPEVVQSLCQAPHPHLLPLAGLHASFGGHLVFALPLRRAWILAPTREAERQVLVVLMMSAGGRGGGGHLGRGADGVEGGGRQRGGLQ